MAKKYYPAILLLSNGRLKETAIYASDWHEAFQKARRKKERSDVEKVFLIRREFDLFWKAVRYAKNIIRERGDEFRSKAIATKHTAPHDTDGNVSEIDLADLKNFLPGLLASLYDVVWSYIKKRSVAGVQVLLKVMYNNGSEELIPTDVEIIKTGD